MDRYLKFFKVDTFNKNYDLIFLDKIAEHCQMKFSGFKGQISDYRE